MAQSGGQARAQDQDVNSSLKLCDKALNLCTSEIELLQEALRKEQEYSAMLMKQRQEMAKALSEQSGPPAIPFYLWVAFGAAAGVVLVRGLR